MTHMALHAVLLNDIKIGMKAVHDSASHADKIAQSGILLHKVQDKKKEEKRKKET